MMIKVVRQWKSIMLKKKTKIKINWRFSLAKTQRERERKHRQTNRPTPAKTQRGERERAHHQTNRQHHRRCWDTREVVLYSIYVLVALLNENIGNLGTESV